MEYKLIAAELPFTEKPAYALLCLADREVMEFRLFPREEESLLGNIYVGKVENVRQDLGGAFLRIADGNTVYLPLKEAKNAIFKTRKRGETLKVGDELLVQVSGEAIKLKQPRASAALHLRGNFFVLNLTESGLYFSSKLSAEEKKTIRRKIPESAEFGRIGAIIRTDAAEASERALAKEYDSLMAQAERLLSIASSRPAYTCLYRDPLYWEQMFAAGLEKEDFSFVTDLPEVYEKAANLSGLETPEQKRRQKMVSLYQDPLLPLYRLYPVEKLLKELTGERVWLSCGGFLVIQQTEAFVSIDVNSGKFEGRKTKEENALYVNRQAASEIVRQIRLRRLSGIVLIDFINMHEETTKKELMSDLELLCRRAGSAIHVVDLTRLQIAELTVRKEGKSFIEQISQLKQVPGKTRT